MKNIVIIGGGFAGISVANKLAHKTRRKDVRILLVEPTETNFYEPQLLFWGFKKYPNLRPLRIETFGKKEESKPETEVLTSESPPSSDVPAETSQEPEENQDKHSENKE